ncbi:GNAT family N-acetyltransferase [Actinoplanes sp. NEAU-A12]|uniref:GNAT family N-acetyltransferase n=1 Tax=Actinoplanes sandaracinus TaxID=3045177 RepID=A0ABT6WUB5_9ACTN|nr:GNAT family N-acetyltransferase [Actinoplanes sandaracinus]MDI6103318.1 GNAT family N-acetyltransferase [Actinoplanes sandaracinus]
MTRSIHRAQPADAEALAHVQAASWRAAFDGLLSAEYLADLDIAALRTTWSGLLSDARWPRAGTLVLREGEDEGRLVGYARFYPSEDADLDPAQVGEIGSMYTVPAVWRTGAGSLLMAAVLDALAGAGYATASLWVLEGNTSAQAFYRAQGWEPDGARHVDRGSPAEVVKLRYRRAVT